MEPSTRFGWSLCLVNGEKAGKELILWVSRFYCWRFEWRTHRLRRVRIGSPHTLEKRVEGSQKGYVNKGRPRKMYLSESGITRVRRVSVDERFFAYDLTRRKYVFSFYRGTGAAHIPE